ncbi:MAG: hypothetical protein J0H82_08395 [Alphaproteobacteria bacterium]|jgi:protein ImuA|nr:hypothetical protein [Alphaproteobacteria bacterium]
MTTAALATLRAELAALQGRRSVASAPAIGLGTAAVDSLLPGGGLRLDALHEIVGDAAATGFLAGILGRMRHRRGLIVWCGERHGWQEGGLPYPPALLAFGVPAERLLLVEVDRMADLMRAVEDSLRSRAAMAVVAENMGLDLTASRRLQLAAEAAETPVFALRRSQGARIPPTVAATRWTVAPDAGSRWQVRLERCRGTDGAGRQWCLEWNDATLCFDLAAALADRSGAAAE